MKQPVADYRHLILLLFRAVTRHKQEQEKHHNRPD
jgi:hypothetical protein